MKNLLTIIVLTMMAVVSCTMFRTSLRNVRSPIITITESFMIQMIKKIGVDNKIICNFAV